MKAARVMQLDDLSLRQLDRLYRNLYRRLVRNSGCGFWDDRTLRIVYPSIRFALRSLDNAIDHAVADERMRNAMEQDEMDRRFEWS